MKLHKNLSVERNAEKERNLETKDTKNLEKTKSIYQRKKSHYEENKKLENQIVSRTREDIHKDRRNHMKRHKISIRSTLDINYFIFLPDDSFRAGWTAYLLLLLAYATTITPFRTAFYSKDPLGWVIVDTFVDCCFLADLIFNFFFAYYDAEGKLVIQRKKIAIKYLTSWFLLDLITIIPFSLLFGDRNFDARKGISRLPRLYKMLKMTKIVRTLRLCRERKNWMGKLERFVPELSPSAERLLAFALSFAILCHVVSCLWYLLARFEGIFPDSWVARYSYQDKSIFELYIACLYFTVTTITTVGYGDFSPGNDLEMIFGLILMMIGVLSYTFAISSLSSIITTHDIRETRKTEALDLLHRIDTKYQLPTNDFLLLNQQIIKKFKEVESYQSEEALMNLLGRESRARLKQTLYRTLVTEMLCFQEASIETHEFASFAKSIASMFKHRKIDENIYIHQEKDNIDNIYFIIRGSVDYVLPEYNDDPYFTIEGKGNMFGELEIVNGMLEGKGISSKRLFTVKTKEDSEFLTLSKTDLMRLYREHNDLIQLLFEESDFKLEDILYHKNKLETDLREHIIIADQYINEQKRRTTYNPLNIMGRPTWSFKTKSLKKKHTKLHRPNEAKSESDYTYLSSISSQSAGEETITKKKRRKDKYRKNLTVLIQNIKASREGRDIGEDDISHNNSNNMTGRPRRIRSEGGNSDLYSEGEEYMGRLNYWEKEDPYEGLGIIDREVPMNKTHDIREEEISEGGIKGFNIVLLRNPYCNTNHE